MDQERAGTQRAGTQRADRPTVAAIVRKHAGQFVGQFPRQAVPQVQSTLAKLSLCRTAALGTRWYRCSGCHRQCKIYNSCGDRHCSQCSGPKRANWVDSTSELLLEGVGYFQVVLTLPGQLSSLALGNRKEVYDLLFTAAWRAVQETVQGEQRYEAAAMMVLHTWNQKLESHGHVHALVPGGGPSLDRPGKWKRTRRRGRDNPKYLARYLTGGPISSRRLISADDQFVRFWAREGKTTGGDRKSIPVRLTPREFVRRWSLHILPKGYVKTRRYGGWSNHHRRRYLDQCVLKNPAARY